MSSIQCPAPRRAALIVSIALLTAALSGCSNKSEAEQLAATRDGVAYTQYRRLSENALPGALAVYRKGLEWSGETPPPALGPGELCAVHVLLAYGALVADKSTLALAETDIVDAKICTDFDRTAAASLRSVVFQRMDWPQLAQAESDRVWGAPTQAGQEQPPVAHVITFHAAMTYLAVSEKRWDRAQVHIDALGQLLRQPWLSQLPRAGFALQEGRTQDALVALKKMSEDRSAPQAVRTELAAIIAKIEAKGGDVDSFAFMPRFIAMATWEAIKEQGPELLTTTTGFVEDQAWTSMGDSVKQGAGKAKDVAGSWWHKALEAVTSSQETTKAEPSKAESPQTESKSAETKNSDS